MEVVTTSSGVAASMEKLGRGFLDRRQHEGRVRAAVHALKIAMGPMLEDLEGAEQVMAVATRPRASSSNMK